MVPRRLDDLVPMGESYVKYVRYVERYGNVLVHAVDSDYMAIALLFYASGGMRDDNRIFVFRQRSTLPSNDNEPDGSSNSNAQEKELKQTPDLGAQWRLY
jgi:hypothetical protein